MNQHDLTATDPEAILAQSVTDRVRQLLAGGESLSRNELVERLCDVEGHAVSKVLFALRSRAEVTFDGLDPRGLRRYRRVEAQSVPDKPTKPAQLGRAGGATPHPVPLSQGEMGNGTLPPGGGGLGWGDNGTLPHAGEGMGMRDDPRIVVRGRSGAPAAIGRRSRRGAAPTDHPDAAGAPAIHMPLTAGAYGELCDALVDRLSCGPVGDDPWLTALVEAASAIRRLTAIGRAVHGC